MFVEPNIEKLASLKITKLQEALSHADIVVILVKHRQFIEISSELINQKIILDFCGALKSSNKSK